MQRAPLMNWGVQSVGGNMWQTLDFARFGKGRKRLAKLSSPGTYLSWKYARLWRPISQLNPMQQWAPHLWLHPMQLQLRCQQVLTGQETSWTKAGSAASLSERSAGPCATNKNDSKNNLLQGKLTYAIIYSINKIFKYKVSKQKKKNKRQKIPNKTICYNRQHTK